MFLCLKLFINFFTFFFYIKQKAKSKDFCLANEAYIFAWLMCKSPGIINNAADK
jgi:hypothetical protein